MFLIDNGGVLCTSVRTGFRTASPLSCPCYVKTVSSFVFRYDDLCTHSPRLAQ